MDQTQLKSIIESLLFVSGEPIKIKNLAKICGVSGATAKETIFNLSIDYKSQNRGLAIIQRNDQVQMTTNPVNSQFVNKFLKTDLASELSRATAETLAIVAYRGPLTRAAIDEIRGVSSNFVLRHLLIRGLVERFENPRDARSYLYRISFDFLRHLGISKVEKLPNYADLSSVSFSNPTSESFEIGK